MKVNTISPSRKNFYHPAAFKNYVGEITGSKITTHAFLDQNLFRSSML